MHVRGGKSTLLLALKHKGWGDLGRMELEIDETMKPSNSGHEAWKVNGDSTHTNDVMNTKYASYDLYSFSES